MSNIQISNPIITIGKADDSIGYVAYNGDIGAQVPQNISIISNNGKASMTVVFENAEKFNLGEMTNEQYELALELEYEIRKGNKEAMIGFYRVGKNVEEVLDPCYKVSVDIDTKISDVTINKINSKIYWYSGAVKGGGDSSKGFSLVNSKGGERYFPLVYKDLSYKVNDDLCVLWATKKESDKIITLDLGVLNKSNAQKVFDKENLEEALFPKPGCLFAIVVICLSILSWIYHKEAVGWLTARLGWSTTIIYALIVVTGGIAYWIWTRLIPRVKAKFNVDKFIQEFDLKHFS